MLVFQRADGGTPFDYAQDKLLVPQKTIIPQPKIVPCLKHSSLFQRADGGTRTHDLLITNQLL